MALHPCLFLLFPDDSKYPSYLLCLLNRTDRVKRSYEYITVYPGPKYVSSFAMYCRVGNFACLITFDIIQLFGVLTAATLEVCQEIALLTDTLKSPDTCSLPPA